PTTAVIFDKILNRAPVPIGRLAPDMPYELERIVERSLEKSVAARYQRARDMLEDLRLLKRERETVRPGDQTREFAALQGLIESAVPYRTPRRVAAASRAIPSIAVLALVDMSPQKDQDYFCEGMAEALTKGLPT